VAGQGGRDGSGLLLRRDPAEVMQDELYRAMHATDVRMVKGQLAEQLDGRTQL
jgi:hypothetical protein